jgi:hypothetical protein
VVEYAIGRGDAPEPRPAGRWDATGRLVLSSGTTGRIVSSAPDRLEITWS